MNDPKYISLQAAVLYQNMMDPKYCIIFETQSHLKVCVLLIVFLWQSQIRYHSYILYPAIQSLITPNFILIVSLLEIAESKIVFNVYSLPYFLVAEATSSIFPISQVGIDTFQLFFIACSTSPLPVLERSGITMISQRHGVSLATNPNMTWSGPFVTTGTGCVATLNPETQIECDILCFLWDEPGMPG